MSRSESEGDRMVFRLCLKRFLFSTAVIAFAATFDNTSWTRSDCYQEKTIFVNSNETSKSAILQEAELSVVIWSNFNAGVIELRTLAKCMVCIPSCCKPLLWLGYRGKHWSHREEKTFSASEDAKSRHRSPSRRCSLITLGCEKCVICERAYLTEDLKRVLFEIWKHSIPDIFKILIWDQSGIHRTEILNNTLGHTGWLIYCLIFCHSYTEIFTKTNVSNPRKDGST